MWDTILTEDDLMELGLETEASLKKEAPKTTFPPLATIQFHGVAKEHFVDAVRMLLSRTRNLRLDDVDQINFFGAPPEEEGQEVLSECRFAIIEYFGGRASETYWFIDPRWEEELQQAA